MTLLAPAPLTHPISVAEVEPGFWVANDHGAFAGTIERHGDHFYVRDCFSQYRGDYPDLTTATGRLRASAEVSS